MEAKEDFPALFDRLVVVTKLDNERKGLQELVDKAKDSRLEAERVLRLYKLMENMANACRNSQCWEFHLIQPTLQLLSTCQLPRAEHQNATEIGEQLNEYGATSWLRKHVHQNTIESLLNGR